MFITNKEHSAFILKVNLFCRNNFYKNKEEGVLLSLIYDVFYELHMCSHALFLSLSPPSFSFNVNMKEET
jgi:hypothetical protein